MWSSGALFSEWGELIARSDPDVPKHKGMTAFIVPMNLPGIEVRPIKQMSGGSSFNEVFFTDVRLPDSMRLGDEGDGWRGRADDAGLRARPLRLVGRRPGRRRLAAGPRHGPRHGCHDGPGHPSAPAGVVHGERVESFVNRRAAEMARNGPPGPEGSLGKLMWTNGMTLNSDVISGILGAALVADTGEWGTFAWGEHVLGAPGYRIAGGSDEVQRNIVGERVLGLPPEPRIDKDVAFKDVPR